jgi:hypothetical protein
MTNKSRTIFRIVRLFSSGRDAGTRGRFQRVVMPWVRRAGRSSSAGVIQPLSGPAGLGDHGKPRVSQLQSRCSRAAKYAP